jgi:ORF6C domain/ORF6N domain
MKGYLVPIEKQGERVLTTEQLAECYETTKMSIGRNFQRNAERYENGKHYFLLEGEELKEFLHTTICRSQKTEKVRSMYLWTERGALLHAKSLNNNKAWEVYDFLVDSYFRVKEYNMKPLGKVMQQSPDNEVELLSGNNMKMIERLNNHIGELLEASNYIEGRVENLENTMTIDYGQQLALQEVAKLVAIDTLGGKENRAYKDSTLRGRVFTTIWKDFKEYFGVNSYKNTAKMEFMRAKEYLNSWRAQGKLLRDIESVNKYFKEVI